MRLFQQPKEAQLRFEDCTLATREKVIADIRAAMRPRVQELAQKLLKKQGMGRVADKVLKLNLTLDKTPGVEDLITECETGDNGMTLYELSPLWCHRCYNAKYESSRNINM